MKLDRTIQIRYLVGEDFAEVMLGRIARHMGQSTRNVHERHPVTQIFRAAFSHCVISSYGAANLVRL